MTSYILAIDQGTTSSRAILFDETFQISSSSQQEFTQYFPASGMVEHDVEEIWHSVVATCRNAIADAGIKASQIAAIGITNQRETTVIWEKATGKAIHPAIVWQDRRTSNFCNELKASGYEETIRSKTGLVLDPYFSATKISWLLDHVDGARKKADNGELLFGTIDTYLLWRLTNGASHKTDATNASRTLLFDTEKYDWDEELLKIFNVPRQVLPTVEDCAAEFGNTVTDLFGASIPVLGIAGDQHAAVLGQACFTPGMIKSTYGTGCFVMLNTGEQRVVSKNRLLSTIAYRIDGKTTYALEGSIFIAGAAVQWLRDGLKIIDHASQTGSLAAEADHSQDVILVPAFAGLGAPYWEPDVRGAIFGLTRNTGPQELSKAVLEAVCYQTRDLVDAMKKDWQGQLEETILRVDGGMVASDWTMQYLADTLASPIDRPSILETTALGAAWLAGMKSGVWPDMEGFSESWKLQNRFKPRLDEAERTRRYKGWLAAVESTISQAKSSKNID